MANKTASIVLVAVLAVPVAMQATVTPTVDLPPFIITGRVVDYEGAGISSAEVRVRKGGVLLARATTGRFESDTSANYTVAVPMSNLDTANAANTDDQLMLEIDAGGATYSDTNIVIAAAKPGRTLKLNLRTASCTNPHGVSDQYLDDIKYDLEDMGLSVDDYDPDADYDGDGVSNYKEYLAGTDAFDADDAGLRILSWRPVPGSDDTMEATFLPGRNRAYSAERANPIADDVVFELRRHRLRPDVGASEKNYLVTGSEEPEVRAIYLYKEGSSSLYRLRLE